MKLLQLHLDHFRNYPDRTFEFDQPVTLLIGPNASGKTSVIEAINLLATGDSFRAQTVDEMIEFNQELARIKGTLDDGTVLEIMLTRGEVQGKKTSKRLFSVNEVRRTRRKLMGHFYSVVFRPEDMRLIEGSPRRRREFLDTILSVVHPEYERSLTTYTQALLKRNRLLVSVREGEMPRSVLTFWTQTILKHGEIIQQFRRQFIEFTAGVPFPVPFSAEYDLSALTEARLSQYADREIAAGHTLIGPHKDDSMVKLSVQTETTAEEHRDIARFGSRGQQRMGVLWLKICQLHYYQQHTGQQPLILLDDILSELDDQHRQLVLDLCHRYQVVITSADPDAEEMIKTELPTLSLISFLSD